MCRHFPLVLKKNGYVIRHSCCHSVELAYQTTLVNMERNAWVELLKTVASMYTENVPDERIKSRLITIDTHVRLVLTQNEVKELHNMLQEAFIVLQAYEWMEETEN